MVCLYCFTLSPLHWHTKDFSDTLFPLGFSPFQHFPVALFHSRSYKTPSCVCNHLCEWQCLYRAVYRCAEAFPPKQLGYSKPQLTAPFIRWPRQTALLKQSCALLNVLCICRKWSADSECRCLTVKVWTTTDGGTNVRSGGRNPPPQGWNSFRSMIIRREGDEIIVHPLVFSLRMCATFAHVPVSLSARVCVCLYPYICTSVCGLVCEPMHTCVSSCSHICLCYSSTGARPCACQSAVPK